ncbi:MAG: NAD(P)-dependent oxidoreductase [Bacteroidaceae bacterium]|nr:NAD(P)-dependent oxidoreductase [Bacteroidaceae bacterium]
MKTILCTKWIPDECMEPFSGIFSFVKPDKEKVFFLEREIKERLTEADILFSVAGTPVSKELIDMNPKLEMIISLGVGFDHVDWKYATQKGIPVINSPSEVTEPTAEHTMALIMAVYHNIPEYTVQMRRGQWVQETFGEAQTQMMGSTLGILGMGRIGKAVAKRAKALGMNVVYFDSYPMSAEQEKEFGVERKTFDEVISSSDCITVHVPFTNENKHMFNAQTFAKMKKGSFFVNAARGGLMNTDDLIAALKSGQMKRAALDVFETEPYLNGALCSLENVILTPHVASQTKTARINMAMECLNGAQRVVNGEKTHNVVNPEVLNV